MLVRWRDAESLRMCKVSGLQRSPGYTWRGVEVGEGVHVAEAMCVRVYIGMFQGILRVIKMFVLVKHLGSKYLCG